MRLVAVFKTDVLRKSAAKKLVNHLQELLPYSKVNFDLDDCDNILRIESVASVDISDVVRAMRMNGYKVDLLQ